MAEKIVEFNAGDQYTIIYGQRVSSGGDSDNGPYIAGEEVQGGYSCIVRVNLPTLSEVSYLKLARYLSALATQDFPTHQVSLYDAQGQLLATPINYLFNNSGWVYDQWADAQNPIQGVAYAVFNIRRAGTNRTIGLDDCRITYTETPYTAGPLNTGDADCPICYASGDPSLDQAISVLNGEKRVQETDLSVNTPAGPLAFSRAYRQTKQGDFQTMGLGWTHSHQVQLVYTAGTPNTVEVRLPRGGEAIFEETSPGSNVYAGVAGVNSLVEYNSGSSQYTLTASDKSTYVFDSSGNLLSRAWPNGETWSYSYSSGKLSEVDDGYGRKLKFSYIDNSGQFNHEQLWRVGDHTAADLDTGSPSGRYVEFTYTSEKSDGSPVMDAKALLYQVRDVRGNTWTYDYYGQDSGEDDADLLNFLLERITPSVDTTGDGTADSALTMEKLSYTLASGEVSQIVQQRGVQGVADPWLEMTYNFQPSGQNVTEEVVAGKTTTHLFSGDNYTGIQDAAGNVRRHAQTVEYRPWSQTDPNGNATLLQWSSDGQRLESVIDMLNQTTQFAYNADNTLYYSLDAEDRKTLYVYGDGDVPRQPTAILVLEAGATDPIVNGDMEDDSNWSDISGQEPVTNEQSSDQANTGGYARHVEADAADEGIEGVAFDLVADRVYALLARVYVESGTVQMSVTGTSAFDQTSSQTGVWETLYVVHQPSSGANDVKLQFTADGGAAEFYVDSVTLLEGPDILRWQAFTYDGQGRTLTEQVIDPADGSTALQETQRSYYSSGDGIGLLFTVTQRDVGGVDDLTTTYTYDTYGRVQKVNQSSNFGSCSVSFTVYDEAGNVVASICNYYNEGSAPTTAAEAADLYDAQYPNQNHVTTHEYDSLGRRVKTTTLAGSAFARTSQTIYDALGRVVRTVQNVDVSSVDDDVAGWVWDATDGRWEDDSAAAIPHGADNTLNLIADTVYNARGQVRLRRDVLGNVTLYGYDDAGRLVKTVQNAYDEDYNNDYSGTGSDPDLSEYAVDQNAGEDQDILSTQQYDAAGNLVKAVDALGRANFTIYDALNRPVKTVQSAKDAATVDLNTGDEGYDPANDPRFDDYVPSDDPDRDIISTTEYDHMGRVIRTTDAAGNVTLMGYDSLGRGVKTVRNAATPTYDLAADPDLSAYSASSEPDEDLISQTVYDDHGRVLYGEDAFGHKHWSGYDGLGRQVKAIVNAQGTATDGGSNDPRSSSYTPSSAADEDLITRTVYDADGRVESTLDVLSRTTRYGYDSLNRQLVVVRNFDGTGVDDDVSLWVWDSDQARWEDKDGTAIPHGDDHDLNLVTRTGYDAQGRVEVTYDSRGNETRFAYDSLGRRVLSVQNFYDDSIIDTDLSNWVWDAADDRWEDGSGNPIPHGSSNDRNRISATIYDVAGRVSSVRDVDGNVTTSSYDRAGRRVQTVVNAVDGFFESGKPDEDLISSSEYNRGGQVVATTDARGTRTTFTYDAAGRRLTVTRAADTPWASTDYTCYDKAGRVLRVIRNWIDNGTSPDAPDQSGGWAFSPTQHGRFNDRNLVTAYAYDAAGRRVMTIRNVFLDSNVHPDLSQWTWDDSAERWQDGADFVIPHGEDNDRNLISTTTYAKDGQVVSTRDALGRQTYHVYDELRRLVRVVQNWVDNGEDPADWVWDGNESQWEKSGGTAIDHGTDEDENIIVDVTLDKAGQRTALRDPRGNQTTYDYDLLGRRTELTNPLSKTWQTAYEEVSGTLRTTLTNPRSEAMQRDTDRLGRLTAISYLSENPKVTPDVSFAYDRAGNRTLMSETVDGGSSYERHTHFHYDDARRLTEVEFDTDGDDNVDETVEYTYEVGGRRTKLVLPDGKVIQYRYDERGQLVGLTDWDDQRARFAYDLAGRLIGIERSNDLRSRYAYDAAGRLQILRHTYQHNTTLAEFAYTVDLLGNRTQVIETLREPDDDLQVQTIAYGYDGLSRLLSADYYSGAEAQGTPTRTYAYEYDVAGNRTKKTVDGTPTSYTYNAANQLTSGGITYDDAGRMASDGTHSLSWDRADRLLSYNGSTYAYNGLGQRVSQTVNSIVTEYLLDVQPGLFVTLTETAQGSTKRFIHGPRGVHALQDNPGDWAWMLPDGLGSVRAEVVAGLVNDVGEYTVNGVQGNTPFGLPHDVAGTFGSSYGFTGEPTDYNDLVHMRARYLNPELGVFPSLDPFEGVIQRAMSLNGYSWVEGRVPNAVDPSGHQLGSSDCSASDQKFDQIDFLVRSYVTLVERQKQWFLDVAHRRRMELNDIIERHRSQIMQAALTRRDCALNSLVSQNAGLLLNSSNLNELFGLTCDEEFAARMAAIPGIVNASGWQGDVITGPSSWLNQIQIALQDPEFLSTQSAGYLELRYLSDEFTFLISDRTTTIGELEVSISGIGEITETIRIIAPFMNYMEESSYNCATFPERCFLDYVNPDITIPQFDSSITQLSNSALAEVAGAHLLRRYVEYLQEWSRSAISTSDLIQDWSLADPTAYAAYCSRAGYFCWNMGPGTEEQGWGSATEQTAARYDVLISHFRHVFDPRHSCTSDRCILRPSQITRLTAYP